MLRDERARESELPPLAWKELVLSGSLVLQPGRRRRFGTAPASLHLTDRRPDPPELRCLWDVVRRHAPQGGRVDQVVRRVNVKEPGLRGRVVATAVTQAVTHGLPVLVPVRVLGIKVHTKMRRTGAGSAVLTQFLEQVATVSLDAPPAVLLMAHPGQAAAIDSALRARGLDSDSVSGLDSMSCFDGSGGDCSGGDGGGGDGGGGDGGC